MTSDLAWYKHFTNHKLGSLCTFCGAGGVRFNMSTPKHCCQSAPPSSAPSIPTALAARVGGGDRARRPAHVRLLPLAVSPLAAPSRSSPHIDRMCRAVPQDARGGGSDIGAVEWDRPGLPCTSVGARTHDVLTSRPFTCPLA